MSRRDEEYIGSRDLTVWTSRAGKWLAQSAVRLTRFAWRRLDESSVPYVVLLVTAAVGAVVVVMLSAASAEIYDDVTERDGIAGLDRPVLDLMRSWRTPGLNSFVGGLTALGGVVYLPIIATASAILLAVWWRRWTPIVLMAVAGGGSLLFTVVGKQLVGRARPDVALAVPPYETSPSFPSGHALNTWVILLIIAYLLVRRLDSAGVRTLTVAVAVLLGVAMGLSRVYLGVHWLTDVLVAWTLGTAWVVMVVTGHRLALTVRRHQHAGANQG